MSTPPQVPDAWTNLADAIKFAVSHITGDIDPLEPHELADGNQYVMRILAAVSESSLLAFDPMRPAFLPMAESVRFLGAAGPDIDYDVAIVQPGVAHQITGTRGGASYVGIAVYGYGGDRGATDIVDSIDVDALVDENGTFVHEFVHPHAARVIIRQYFHDRQSQAPGNWQIDRLDIEDAEEATDSVAAAPLRARRTDPVAIAGRITNAAQSVRWNAQLNSLWTPELRQRPHSFVRQTADDIVAAVSNPDVMYSFSWWAITSEECIIIDIQPPECAYWSIQLCDRWFQCQPHRRTNLNDRQLVREPDGSVRVVIAHVDPGHPNWLDTSGHRTGTMFFRWLHADPEQLPTCTVLPIDDLEV